MTSAASKSFNGIELTMSQAVQISIRCAESVLHIFEAAHPTDQRPRAAIQVAREWLLDPRHERVDAAYVYAARNFADAAAYAGRAAAYAEAYAIAHAAYAAGYTVSAVWTGDASYAAWLAVADASAAAAYYTDVYAAPMQARPGDMISIPLLEGSLQTCLLLLDTDTVLTPDGHVEELTNELRFVLTLPAA
jgi:hypothetical protein